MFETKFIGTHSAFDAEFVHNIAKQPSIQELTVQENGTYTAPDGVDGYSPVTVNVSASSDGTNERDAIISRTITSIESDVKTVGYFAFRRCTKLETAKFPKATTLQQSCLYDCTALTTVDLGAATSIANTVMQNCSNLVALIIRTTTNVCTLTNANSLDNTKIKTGTGYIYVPSALVESYKTATNWATYANQFRAIEDYPGICG